MFNKKRVLCFAVAAITCAAPRAFGQGCVAAHSNQHSFDELVSSKFGPQPASNPDERFHWVHNLTVDLGYRVFNSNKYYQGSTEIARPSAVENHQNIFDVALEYRLNPRWSIIGDIPVFNG